MISIVIPVYAAAPAQLDLLDETLSTVDAQAPIAFEAIVVDDGSPLPVDAVVAGHRHAIAIRRRNGGSAAARNTGIAASRGDAFVFLDADDHLLPGALEIQTASLAANPACGFVVGGREEMTFEGEPVPWGVPEPPRTAHLFHTLLAFDWYVIPPSSAMFRRAVVDAAGGFRDPWGADDLDFYLRAARRFEAHLHATPVTQYRRYRASSSRDGERMLHSIRAVYARLRPEIAGDAAAQAAFDLGLARLTEIFRDCLAENVVDRWRGREWRRALRSARMLMSESPPRLRTACRRLLGERVAT
jgi:glycosyltransferase involved in cell wall biosynthesis